ncbi:hypothetical protein SAMN05660706_1088 [Desulfoscipio geothermicus DSM 3669]|uniref:Uncharacterized protein n=1 Tax=Desulfoscipio geothermicus DSM 3669 TaxID=1121426 RepID=A0A1I6DAN2_9FIRM|nr:hypothetical protein SAMN05660706_1088 [Desulfoscipio geothermicus DSM 3669]
MGPCIRGLAPVKGEKKGTGTFSFKIGACSLLVFCMQQKELFA